MYQIETKDKYGTWTSEVGTDNVFATRESAEAIIAELRKIGPDWAEAEYRVVEIE